MKTKQIIGFGLLLILVTLILVIAMHNIPGSSAAHRQGILASPAPTVMISTTVLESTQAVTPEATLAETVLPVQIPLCNFEAYIQPTLTKTALYSYTFSDPEVVLTSTTPIHLLQWLPDGQRWLISRAMIDVAGEYIETFNLDTGEIKHYAERHSSAGKPIWLPTEQAVAFVDSMPPDYTRILYLGRGEELPLKELAWDLANPLLSLGPDEQIIYSANSRGIQTMHVHKPATVSTLVADLPGQDAPGWTYSDAWRADGTIVAVYVYPTNQFYLVNRVTGETCEMELGQPDSNAHISISVSDMAWSADGRYLALRRIYGNPERFLSLRIIDTLNREFRDITFEGRSVHGLDWSPNDNVLLLTVDTDNIDPLFASFDALYVVEVGTYNIHSILPEHNFFVASYFGALWNPNGRTIGLACSEVKPPDEVIEWRMCVVAVELQQ